MKILIQDYTSIYSTEPMYLNASLSYAKCFTPFLWNTKSISTFDAIDKSSPDLIICNYETSALSDIIKYLSQKKIDIVMNITGINQNKLDLLETILDSKGVKCKGFISNTHALVETIKPKKTPLINLLPAADLFLGQNKQVPEFKLQAGFVTTGNKSLVESKIKKYKTYHKIQLGNKNDQFYDINTDINGLSQLYDRYQEFIILDSAKMIFSQLFFDATLKSNKTTLVSDDKDTVDRILGSLFEIDENAKDIGLVVKNQVKKSHNCIIRTSELMQKLGHTNGAKLLKEAVGKLL